MPYPDLLAGRWADVSLSQNEYARYSRHIIMPEVGLDGQKKLKAAKVLVIGTGGLGSPLALYLAAAGVGTIGLVDFDTVDASNLHGEVRQSELVPRCLAGEVAGRGGRDGDRVMVAAGVHEDHAVLVDVRDPEIEDLRVEPSRPLDVPDAEDDVPELANANRAGSGGPFVRLLEGQALPDTKNVVGTNVIEIGWRLDPRTGRLIVMSAEDNLVKGASGQAVQSLNILCGWPETAGLI